MKILLVEDEIAIARMIARGLAPHGIEMFLAESGEDETIDDHIELVDLVLLDLHLPGSSGLELLTRIRRIRSELPIIMLTAQSDLKTKVSALNQGADDYVTKPFEFEELIARIRAQVRRSEQGSASAFVFGPLSVDLLSHRAAIDGQSIEFSKREFALLEYFCRNPGRLLSRQQILTAVWEYDFEGESNVVDVYVGYLRQKLGKVGLANLFTTIRGSGYRFDPPT